MVGNLRGLDEYFWFRVILQKLSESFCLGCGSQALSMLFLTLHFRSPCKTIHGIPTKHFALRSTVVHVLFCSLVNLFYNHFPRILVWFALFTVESFDRLVSWERSDGVFFLCHAVGNPRCGKPLLWGGRCEVGSKTDVDRATEGICLHNAWIKRRRKRLKEKDVLY